jgi:glycopeptide antibiotics resistance protein
LNTSGCIIGFALYKIVKFILVKRSRPNG